MPKPPLKPRLLAPARAFVPTQRAVAPVLVRPVAPPVKKLRNVLRPIAKPLAPARGPTERAVAPALVRPVLPPVKRMRNVLRPVAKPLAPARVPTHRVVAPMIAPVSTSTELVPTVYPAAHPLFREVVPERSQHALAPYLVPPILPPSMAYETSPDSSIVIRMGPILKGRHYAGFGYSESTGFPTITTGATDDNTGNAVTWVVLALKKATYSGKDTAYLDSLSGYTNRMKFGSKIKSEVEKFQSAKGLTADGIVGKNTYKALGYTGPVVTGETASGSAAASAPATAPAETGDTKAAGGGFSLENITQQVWFWPAAILVPTAAVIAGILLWPSKPAAKTTSTLVPA